MPGTMIDTKAKGCESLANEEIDAANREALGRISQAFPILVDVQLAGEVIRDLGQNRNAACRASARRLE